MPHHIHHLSLWPGNIYLIGQRSGIALKYRWHLKRMKKQHHHHHTHDRHWLWKIWSEKVELDWWKWLWLAWEVLFYGQQLLGEGLSLGEARDAAFTLCEVIIWVGKQSQLETKPVSLGDGWQLIAQAITEGHIEHSGPGYPCSTTPVSTSFNFCNPTCLHDALIFSQWLNNWRCLSLPLGKYHRSEADHHS